MIKVIRLCDIEDVAASLLSVRLDWLMQVARECQVFLTQLAGAHPASAQIPHLAERFLSRLADPSNAAERLVFRTMLLQMSIHLSVSAAASPDARAALERMVSMFRDWGDRSREMKSLLLETARGLVLEPQTASPAHRARRYIDTHYASALTIGAVARAFGCHPKRLARDFRQEYGKSMPDYLAAVRVKHAVEAIRRSDLKVEAIASMVGYRSKKNFYRAVRRVTGLTPLQLRRSPRHAAASH